MFECEWIAVLAEGERINIACLSSVLRLTMLALEFVKPVLDGRQLTGLQMNVLLRSLPVEWESQGTPSRVNRV